MYFDLIEDVSRLEVLEDSAVCTSGLFRSVKKLLTTNSELLAMDH